MYDRILVATDGSADAERAAEHAVDLARRYGAELHCLYVIETRTAYDNAIVEPEIVHRRLREEGEEALDAIEADARGVGTVVSSIESGVPAEVITAYSDENGIDLVVMGAKGKSAFKTILLGSTTEAVVRSGLPVLIVGEPER
ncbi:universal stress protein [Halalkalicoccus paucihalophilus]|uniref:Universal stress protein n=1 Tax=Halalkalicoccus paucihalophilus TaxID=1008153 RepID=A0A151AE67_9EURY|nr:universal stress protein [Halalkalicoccus paucihalophilus]KYH25925.1 universal stress protein [Halalkalicoccus paucihalophilus]